MNSYKIRSSPPKWAIVVFLLAGTFPGFAAPKNSGSIAVNPANIAFGSVTVGTSSLQNVVLLNTGTGNVTIANASVSGAGFSVTGLALPLTLGPGQSATFQTQFAPTSAGSVSGSVALKKNSGTVLASVALSGAGLAASSSLDTTAPVVAVTGPTNGSTISGTVALTANASDNVGVVGVQFYVNSTAIGAEVTAAPYSVNWNTATVANGSGYVITARARDAAGNQTTSAGVTTTVSNVTHAANLTWVPSPSVVVGYYVYRATQTGGPYSRVTTAVDPSTAYTDATVVSGGVYYYVVTAVDASNVESGYSTEAVASIPQ